MNGNRPAADTYAPATVEFQWRDMSRVLGLALDVSKWYAGLLPLLTGATLLLVGLSLPGWLNAEGPAFVWLTRILGVAAAYYGMVFSVAGVAYQVRGEVIDNQPRIFGDVLDMWSRHCRTLVMVPIYMLIFAVVVMVPVVIGGGLAALLAMSEGLRGLAGVLWVLVMIPGVFLALGAAIVLLVLAIGSLIYPVVVAVKEEEAFDVIHDLFDLVKIKVPHLILTALITTLFVAAVSALYFGAVNGALGIGALVTPDNLVQNLLQPPAPDGLGARLVGAFHNLLRPLIGLWHDDPLAAGWGMGLLQGVLFLYTAAFLGYVSALFGSGVTMGYLIVADPFDIEVVVERVQAEQEQAGAYVALTAVAAVEPSAAADSGDEAEQEASSEAPKSEAKAEAREEPAAETGSGGDGEEEDETADTSDESGANESSGGQATATATKTRKKTTRRKAEKKSSQRKPATAGAKSDASGAATKKAAKKKSKKKSKKKTGKKTAKRTADGADTAKSEQAPSEKSPEGPADAQ